MRAELKIPRLMNSGSCRVGNVEHPSRMNYAEFSVELGQVSAMSMVDVDMTALVSGAIFIVVALLLNALLIQPYLRIVRERAALTTGAQDSADETAEKAAALLTEYQEKLAAARSEAGENSRRAPNGRTRR